MKPSTAILRNGKPFYHPEFSKDIHYEAEIVLKICKNGRHVQPKFALSYFEEIGLGLDMTARDIQSQCKSKGHPWEIAKAFDNSAVVSNFIDKSSLPDQSAINFQLHKNGELVQDGNTKDMIFNFTALICHISKYFTLHNGDYIFTGTPAGVGKIEIGDELVGSLEDQKILNCQIR
jgi:2-keto-4-pentenoate hydratase/2-oxohepta-3-ene-1,7-dioic acid hydratase in catechol pathway